MSNGAEVRAADYRTQTEAAQIHERHRIAANKAADTAVPQDTHDELAAAARRRLVVMSVNVAAAVPFLPPGRCGTARRIRGGPEVAEMSLARRVRRGR